MGGLSVCPEGSLDGSVQLNDEPCTSRGNGRSTGSSIDGDRSRIDDTITTKTATVDRDDTGEERRTDGRVYGCCASQLDDF